MVFIINLLIFQIVAQEVSPGQKPLFSSVNVTVYVTDVNDNPPVFQVAEYAVTIPENVTTGSV